MTPNLHQGSRSSCRCLSEPSFDSALPSILKLINKRKGFGMNWEKYLPWVEFAYNNSYHTSLGMSPFETLYGRKCRSLICWMELSEKKLVGLELVLKTEEKVMVINNHLKIAQNHRKAYGEKKKKKERCLTLENIIHFGLRRKLSPRFIGPYEILERIGPIEYQLALPPELSKIHIVFHFVCILDKETKTLINKEISLVKVLWRNHKVEKATWKRESTVREKIIRDCLLTFDEHIFLEDLLLLSFHEFDANYQTRGVRLVTAKGKEVLLPGV
ncbi:reverse transcriptase [Gossypium australe]|uniref:Reverse transcriptase n=1 Tax=Gossypium australe TaxID=47621 RepID=A0A5B6VYN7_9ROSI|nr:reverse transcriptase [Gossypium australe]